MLGYSFLKKHLIRFLLKTEYQTDKQQIPISDLNIVYYTKKYNFALKIKVLITKRQ